MSNVYSQADKANKRIFRKIEAEFQRLAVLTSWDEINVTQTVKETYQRIDEFSREQFREIARSAYRAAKETKEPEDNETFSPDVFILFLLAYYDEKTQYRYDREWERKRDRLTESLLAISQNGHQIVNSNEIRRALRRGLNLLENQVGEMTDTVTDEAREQAFVDDGVKKVVWNSQKDGGVCAICQERDGNVYPIGNVPTKHRHCRCYLTRFNPWTPHG